jgi:hypothetical protein
MFGTSSVYAECRELTRATVKLRHTDVLRSSGLSARRFGQDINELVDHPTEPRLRCELPIYESPPGSINLSGKPCLSPQSSANTECANQCSEVFGKSPLSFVISAAWTLPLQALSTPV